MTKPVLEQPVADHGVTVLLLLPYQLLSYLWIVGVVRPEDRLGHRVPRSEILLRLGISKDSPVFPGVEVPEVGSFPPVGLENNRRVSAGKVWRACYHMVHSEGVTGVFPNLKRVFKVVSVHQNVSKSQRPLVALHLL